MDRHYDVAPPRHALRPSAADAYTFETGRPAVSEGVALTAVAMLAGAPALGTALAIRQGQWFLMLVLLHVGGLALWFGLSGRGWCDLLTGGGIRSRTVLFTTGALGGVAFGGLHTWMGPTGTGPLWKPEITASTVLHALVFALTVGIAYNAIPEEITLRRTLFSPVHERLGATAAVLMTTVSFTALHLPTWLTSDTSLKGYAWQILHKVLFGLLAGWSVVRLRSMFFALGLHISGNALGLFIGQLQSENLPDFEISWLNATILLAGAAVVAGLILLLGRRRRVPSPVF
ncbi:CPBP family intramembrane glutamic endopeptidase [Actinomyces sp. oral taxon 171]|uniref:CPBP family intramembrane glutamic endopeptidase n=1 Tax=Actinomyces sp. oral taxon 171 TaxID=706438 RepID=UPI0001F6269E|nr:CPBP family intramembrane glutamic endopeptidase [Actinomyces sp. oral taxon 171]EFW27501.1 CAAX amino terminal protease family protein [Actinomyces sp. oral taxon 171 str. F0337]QCT33659.1 CPBP family intramembrane metalloprotease [Actinomyces sp. oral taxon 171 str. F0337]